MLTGRLADTDAPMRTLVAATIALDDGPQTFTLRTPYTKVDGDNVMSPGVEAAVAAENKTFSAVAAVAVAPPAEVPFEKIGLSPEVGADVRDRLRNLYDGISAGEVDVSYMPGATLSPTKFTSMSLFGLKADQQTGEIMNVKTKEADLMGRGHFDGIVGVRYVAQSVGKTVEPVVKAIQPDGRVPLKTSAAFVRADLQSVGERAFRQFYNVEDNRDLDQVFEPPAQETSNSSSDMDPDFEPRGRMESDLDSDDFHDEPSYGF